jgi:hypothetical protein
MAFSINIEFFEFIVNNEDILFPKFGKLIKRIIDGKVTTISKCQVYSIFYAYNDHDDCNEEMFKKLLECESLEKTKMRANIGEYIRNIEKCKILDDALHDFVNHNPTSDVVIQHEELLEERTMLLDKIALTEETAKTIIERIEQQYVKYSTNNST